MAPHTLPPSNKSTIDLICFCCVLDSVLIILQCSANLIIENDESDISSAGVLSLAECCGGCMVNDLYLIIMFYSSVVTFLIFRGSS